MKGEIEKIDLLTAENASVALGTAATSCGVAQGKIMQALRLALTGGASGPDLMETMAILGAGEVASRLAYALGALGKK